MYDIQLARVPNQEVNYVVGNQSFNIQLRTIQGLTFASISLDGEPLLYSQLCCPNSFINLYHYISVGGKFFFKCVDNEYPNYTKFGEQHILQFYTEEEL